MTLGRMVRTVLLCIAAAGVWSGCERRPLVDPGSGHYVRVYVDTAVWNHTCGFYDREGERVRPLYRAPEVMRVMLCDRTTGRPAAERYLRNRARDESGRLYFDGYILADPGDYHLLAYNFGTESTVLDGVQSWSEATATTSSIASDMLYRLPSYRNLSADQTRARERVVYQPDHLYGASRRDIHVRLSDHTDTLYTPTGEYFTALPHVESWYLQIRIKGVQYVSSVIGLLSGMSGQRTLNDGSLHPEDPVTLYVEMRHTDPVEDEATLYATFTTFGRLSERTNDLELNFDLITTDGRAYIFRVGDIASEFGKPDALDHRWILLERTIEVPAPDPDDDKGGGFTPGVNDWEDVYADLTI